MMKYISSKDNPIYKLVNELATKHKKTNHILLENRKHIVSAIESGFEIVHLIRRAGFDETFGVADRSIVDFDPGLFDRLTTVETPQGYIAVFNKPERDIELSKINKILYLDRVQDPGNIGTIIRSAVAFGIDAILYNEGCADPYSQKVIRSSAGYTLNIPIYKASNDNVFEIAKSEKFTTIALVAKGDKNINDIKAAKYILIAGNEGSGIDKKVIEKSDIKASIPTQVESLNVAMAVSIALYQLSKGQY
jgi:TrmH family RNA methyltransferase